MLEIPNEITDITKYNFIFGPETFFLIECYEWHAHYILNACTYFLFQTQ